MEHNNQNNYKTSQGGVLKIFPRTQNQMLCIVNSVTPLLPSPSPGKCTHWACEVTHHLSGNRNPKPAQGLKYGLPTAKENTGEGWIAQTLPFSIHPSGSGKHFKAFTLNVDPLWGGWTLPRGSVPAAQGCLRLFRDTGVVKAELREPSPWPQPPTSPQSWGRAWLKQLGKDLHRAANNHRYLKQL